jgi:hypothetical protein
MLEHQPEPDRYLAFSQTDGQGWAFQFLMNMLCSTYTVFFQLVFSSSLFTGTLFKQLEVIANFYY